MYPVAIIGGGPVGLTCSILLALQDIPNVVFERRDGSTLFPKAIGINQRSMEVFRKIGLEQIINQNRAHANEVSNTAWYTSLGPNSRRIYSRKTNQGGESREDYWHASPTPWTCLPQLRFEPLLKEHALQLNPGGIHFNSEVVDLLEEDDHVNLMVKHPGNGETENVKVRYALGCDGGRFVSRKLGIACEGPKDLIDMVTAHIRAPVSLFASDRNNLLTWLINPRLGGSIASGYIYGVGPYPARPDTEEWVFAFAKNLSEPLKFNNEAIKARIRGALEIPHLPVQILTISNWTISAVVAEKYQSSGGRVFLVGDAAHRIPPWGALGMNTGIQDAFNLAWKIALKIKKGSDSSLAKLLATYGTERQDIGRSVAKMSLYNFMAHGGIMDKALGLSPDNTVEENERRLEAYLNPRSQEGLTARLEVEKAQKVLDGEFHAIGADVGWFYPSVDVENEGSATRHDGQLDERGEFIATEYHPSTLPGHHVPHAWLSKDDTVKSTIDLVPLNRFLLLTQTAGIWEHAASDDIVVEVIDNKTHWRDLHGIWPKLSGVQAEGALLVRPNNIVAYRWKLLPSTSSEKLGNIVSEFLSKMGYLP